MSILAESWFGEFLWPETAFIVRVVVAMLLGGLIGLEREVHDKPAGLRTIVLICVGACVFTIVSQVAGGPDWQSTRIAAQIVSGIGFLGAGAILRERASIIGLTTAATIWAVAAIGMAVGFGHVGLATVGTVAILVALLIFDFVEEWVGDRRDIQEYHIVARNEEETLQRIDELFSHQKLSVRKQSCYEEGASLIVDVIAMGAKPDHDRLRLTLTRSPEYTLRRQ